MSSPGKRVALIVGGTGSIGSAIAEALAQEHTDIALCYKSCKARAEELVERLRSQYSVRAQALSLDLLERDSIFSAYAKASSILGTPNIIIHAAGDTRYGLIQEMTEADYDYLMNMHVRGSFYLSQVSLEQMRVARWGRIILISSIWGEVGAAMEVLYSAAKAAQIGFVKSLANELVMTGITVNAVAPGAIQGKLLERQLSEEDLNAVTSEIPMGRLGLPREVAAAVRYLTLVDSDYVTGQVLRVNGGWM